MTKRLFIALPLPLKQIEKLADYFKSLDWAKAKWTKPENLHLTIYFLGEVRVEDLESLKTKIQETLVEIKPFVLEFDQIKFGPSGQKPTMLWAVFKDNREDFNFRQKIFLAVKEFLTSANNRPPKLIPHMTLAKFKDGDYNKKIQPLDLENLRVFKCQLIESQLTKSGSVYTILAEYDLK
ncbi:MAG: 2'-5' RNA ligase [Candidatus Buchananbacteria bacterium RIFCSPHIGHO2_02_FULL_40_13]|uniref:RNA 2',3'-cyclic phosphodiesterase n=1 Tax=Candidatus Buchananbacteria bacterium RIFCSPLOWO2_01_FULL_39_33 TaxID=1797543 RepID=A0A1G1YLW2_9BACT|nr:MAG: 2'-5' RNA ligase [Candidatus Buchananbacteria bacterium RIFCSPHIGHO2_02_FULL_40_13]OGY52437.1 MAG: 2'-5' RNA ligase [Candidatus Buchananbacteria bacterium RIFCSPLOWO2_01_FULL_39_33]